MLTKKLTTWILVCDGGRGRILAQTGAGAPIEQVTEAKNAASRQPSRAAGADKPGRSFDSAGQGRHAMEPPADWHDFEKEKFAREMAAIINTAGTENRFDRLILVAPPRVLGDLRQALDGHAMGKVAGELGKDLTNVPIHDLGPHLDEWVRG